MDEKTQRLISNLTQVSALYGKLITDLIQSRAILHSGKALVDRAADEIEPLVIEAVALSKELRNESDPTTS